MSRIILACALAGVLAVPANALDGTPSPATVPPAVGGLPGDIPNTQYWHNPNLERAAKELLEQSRQLRRDAADLLAQANPGTTTQGVDPLIGTWKYNPEKSTTTDQVAKNWTMTFIGEGRNFINTFEGVDDQGHPFKGTLKHIYDGKPYPVTGVDEYDSNAFTRVGNTINGVRSKMEKWWRFSRE